MQDRLLIWKFKLGSTDALRQIYEKYAALLLTLATALLDVNTAEDVVHDVFVSFARSADKLKPDGNLKAYLATCVINRTRDHLRAKKRQPVNLENANIYPSTDNPTSSAIVNEELRLLHSAIKQLPYEQQEVVVLRTKGQLKFRQIAKLQNTSIKTVQSRYQYGLEKIRTIVNGEVKK